MEIPYQKLSPEVLLSVIEEFVTRSGTDYGEMEVPLQKKIEDVKYQLKIGKAAIYYDEDSYTCNILLKNE